MVGVSLEPEDQPVVDDVLFAVPGGDLADEFLIEVVAVDETVVLDVLDHLEEDEPSDAHDEEEPDFVECGLDLAVLFVGGDEEEGEVGPVGEHADGEHFLAVVVGEGVGGDEGPEGVGVDGLSFGAGDGVFGRAYEFVVHVEVLHWVGAELEEGHVEEADGFEWGLWPVDELV